jgi:hypothetical protein
VNTVKREEESQKEKRMASEAVKEYLTHAGRIGVDVT